MSVLLHPRHPRRVRSVAALAAAVFGLAWPPSCCGRRRPARLRGGRPQAVAWLLRSRRQDRPALLVAVALASGAANVVGGRPASLSAAFGAVNALEALVICGWLTRPGASSRRLRRVGDVVRFLVAVRPPCSRPGRCFR